MVYHGRIIITGETDSGNPFAGYAISGRSKGNQKRKFERGTSIVRVSPLGKLTPEQEKLKDLIFYNAMRTREDKLIVTNGSQTDVRIRGNKAILNFFDNFDSNDPIEASRRIMTEWGYETDPPICTPRISLVRYPGTTAIFSIATKFQDGVGVGAVEVEVERGVYARGLATYRAEDDNAVPWSIPNSEYLLECLLSMKIRGSSPQELVESLYGFLDPRFVVSAAGAILRNGEWDIAVKNKFETEEDFNR